nr:RebF-like flavin reductase [uncultured bacterium]
MSFPVPGHRSDRAATEPAWGPPAGPVPAHAHRDLMSSFPTGVSVVTAVDRGGRPHGMTCTSLSSVTLTPPTLLVCLDTRSGTLRAIRESGYFAVNLLHARAREVAQIFSTAVSDRFGRVPWGLSEHLRQPWLTRDAFALAGCAVRRCTVFGDHEVVLGEVCEVVHNADVPLLYGMRRFSAWLSDGAPEPVGAAPEPGA